MRYKLQNIRINRGVNSRGKYEWLQAELFNDKQPWANPARLPQMPSMTQSYIDMFKEEGDSNLKEIPEYKVERDGKVVLQVFEVTKLPKVETIAKRLREQDETLDEQESLEEAKDLLKNAISHISHVHTVVQPLIGLWRPVYRRDTTVNGVRYPAGSPRIGANGKPVPAVRSLRVVVRQAWDEDSQEWVDVENPEDIANLMLERSYEKIEEQAAQPKDAAPVKKADSTAEETSEALTEEQKAEMQKRIDEMKKLMGQ